MDKKEWAQLPMTREFVKKLHQDRLDICLAWAEGDFAIAENAEYTLQLNAKHLGQAQAIQIILEWIDEDVSDHGIPSPYQTGSD